MRQKPLECFYRKQVVTTSHDFYLIERNRIVGILRKRNRYKGNNILDVGCGCGGLLATLQANELKVGVDISSRAIETATNNVQGTLFVVCAATNLPFRKNCFDFIVCSEVLEHVESPEKVLRQVHYIIEKRGVFVVTVPNLVEVYGWVLLLIWFLLALKNRRIKDLVEYYRATVSVSGIRSFHLGHLHVKPPTSWRKMIMKNGFRIERSFGILLLPLRTFIYDILGQNATRRIIEREDRIRYTFPASYTSNGIGFVVRKVYE